MHDTIRKQSWLMSHIAQEQEGPFALEYADIYVPVLHPWYDLQVRPVGLASQPTTWLYCYDHNLDYYLVNSQLEHT